MRLFLALIVVFLTAVDSADAAVEAQICGIWQSDDGTILRIQTDGQFSKSTAGRTETGTITALDGKWSLQSNNGKPDSGTFSVLKDSLTLRSSFTSTTTWQRSSGASHEPPSVVHTIRDTSAPQLQSSISQAVRQSIQQTSTADPFNPPQNYENRPSETTANRPIHHGFRDSVKALVENVASNKSDGSGPYFGNQSGFTGNPSGGAGHGTYSEMRKAFEQEQLNSLPPARPISNNPQADETALYGVTSFERRALGPATPIRIKMF